VACGAVWVALDSCSRSGPDPHQIETKARVRADAAVEARGTAHDGCERDLWDPHVRTNRPGIDLKHTGS